MVKTIIYDFDGTIADSLGAVITIYNRMAAEKGFKPVSDKNREVLRGLEPRKVLKELGVGIYQIPQLLLRGRNEAREAIKTMKAPAGIPALIHKMKNLGHRQGIITTNTADNVKEFLKNNKIGVFDFLSCGHSGFGKAKAIKKLLVDLDVNPQDAIYVGDEVRDIEAARQAKIKIVSVAWGYNNKEALQRNHPDALIDKPGELLNAIVNL